MSRAGRIRAVAGRLLREDLARGSGVNLAFTALNAVVALAAAIVAARVLGPEGVGIVALGLLIVEFMSVVDNVPTAGFMRDYSIEPGAEKVATVFVVKGVIGLGLSASVALASPLLARLLDIPLVVPLVLAFIPLASVVDSVAIMSHEARRDMMRRNAPMVAENAGRLALYAAVAVVPFLPWDRVTAVTVATLLASFIGTFAGAFLLPSFRLRLFDARKAREYLSFGLRHQTAGAFQKIIFWVDILVIDLYLGHAVQGLYKAAYQLMWYLPLAAGTVGILLFPSIARHHGRGDRESVRRTLSLGWFYGLAVALPLVMLFMLAAEPLVVMLLGEAFRPSAAILRALAGVGLIAVFLLPFESFFPAINRPDISLRLMGLQMVLNLSLDLLLVPRWGVWGAIVASGVAFSAALLVAVGLVRRLGYGLPTPVDLWRVLRGTGPPR